MPRVSCCVLLFLVACTGEEAKRAEFSITVGPDHAPVIAGSARWLKVDLVRYGGFAGDVDVTAPEPPSGVSGDFLTFSEDATTGAFELTVGGDTPLGDLTLELVATSDGASTSTQVVVTVFGEEPTANEKIAAALAAGDIDLGTSLLYRCYARFGDDLLPEDFRGSGAEEDLALPHDIEVATPELSADMLDALHPYTVRPDHPDSVYTWTGARVVEPAGIWAPDSCADGNQWRSRRSATIPVRVWIECDATTIESSLSRTLALFEKLWPPMTANMDEPTLDAGGDDDGGDDAIDVYLVQGGITRAENGRPTLHDLDRLQVIGAAAYAVPAAPDDGWTSSGYLIVSRIGALGQRLRGSLTHELFHVLQFHHNVGYNFVDANGPHWFMEASATWATVHYDRTLPWPARIAGDVHRGRFGRFQEGQGIALNAQLPTLHKYSAYIWPFFQEQLAGSNNAFMGDTWRALEEASDFATGDEILDEQGDFAENFHTFSLRNLNSEYLPGDPLPLAERYKTLDDLFPDGDPQPVRQQVPLAEGTYTHDVDMPELSAAYFLVTTAADGATTRKVEFDLTGLQPEGALDVDALVHTSEDEWVSAPVSMTGEGKVVFCFDEGPSTSTRRGSFDAMELVLSNHALEERVAGELVITPSDAPCEVWAGTTLASMDFDDGVARLTQTLTATVAFEFDDETPALGGETPYRLQAGELVHERLYDNYAVDPPCRTLETAATALYSSFDPTPGATTANLVVYAGDPSTYYGSGSSWVDVTTVTNCNDDHVDVTTEALSFLMWWFPAGGVYEVQEDGTIRDESDGLQGEHYEWQFTRMRQ